MLGNFPSCTTTTNEPIMTYTKLTKAQLIDMLTTSDHKVSEQRQQLIILTIVLASVLAFELLFS
jgi:hypothetical protein